MPEVLVRNDVSHSALFSGKRSCGGWGVDLASKHDVKWFISGGLREGSVWQYNVKLIGVISVGLNGNVAVCGGGS